MVEIDVKKKNKKKIFHISKNICIVCKIIQDHRTFFYANALKGLMKYHVIANRHSQIILCLSPVITPYMINIDFNHFENGNN